MRQIQGAIPLHPPWKITITTEGSEEGDHEWVVAALMHGEEYYCVDAMKYDGKGDIIDIVDPLDEDVEGVLQEFKKFEMKWRMNALELGLPFEVDDQVTRWANDLTLSCAV